MRLHLLTILFCLATSHAFTQQAKDCEQLAIKFCGLVNTGEKDQLFFEVSNALYSGNLYNYPGFLLINEQGDTIAQEETNYYGIGTNFQTHLLDVKGDLSFPFVGRLELWGSYYQNSFCSFPMTIEKADKISLLDTERREIRTATNYAGDQLIIDLGGVYHESEVKYRLEILDEEGELVHASVLTTDVSVIPVKAVGGRGTYQVRIWDEVSERLLPETSLVID